MNKKRDVGYKAVQSQGNRYISFCYDTWAGLAGSLRKFKVYGIGKTTKRTRGDGPLAVFPEKEEALKLVEEYGFWLDGECKVFKCRYVESKTVGLWQYYRGKYNTPHYTDPTTIFADEVELIEEVTA